jgi:hypothetical protein
MSDRARDYHQYVFREGKLIGDFEAMYRNSKAIPRHQDKQESWLMFVCRVKCYEALSHLLKFTIWVVYLDITLKFCKICSALMKVDVLGMTFPRPLARTQEFSGQI